MKFLLGLMSMTMCLSSFAMSGETKSFTLDSNTGLIESVLYGEHTRTEWRDRTIRSTCYRTITEYRTICTNPPRHPGPPRGPRHPGPPRGPRYAAPYCQQVPIQRTVSYSCNRTERISYEVKDYDVQAQVSIDPVNVHEFPGVRGVISKKLYGEYITLSASGFKDHFVMIKERKDQINIKNGTKFIDRDYKIELVEAAPILSALTLDSLRVNGNGLDFEVGQIGDVDALTFSLKIVQKKLFGSDPVIIDRTLTSHEIELTDLDSKSVARVDFSRLNLDIRNAKYEITAKIEFKHKGLIINNVEFPNLTASKTLTYKAN